MLSLYYVEGYTSQYYLEEVHVFHSIMCTLHSDLADIVSMGIE